MKNKTTITSTKGKLAIFMKSGDNWILLAKADDQEHAEKVKARIEAYHAEKQYGPHEMKIGPEPE